MSRTHLFISLAIVLVAFLVTGVLYAQLPDPFPTHWNARGDIDGWTPKPLGPFLVPMAALLVWGLFAALPTIYRGQFSAERFGRPLGVMAVTMAAFLTGVHGVAIAVALGHPLPMNPILFSFLGVLLVITGNFFGKLTRNGFAGIRTPWTLASDEVWFRTHRLGGKLFVGGGLGMIVAAAVQAPPLPTLIALLTLIVAVPAVYSYVVWRQLPPEAR